MVTAIRQWYYQAAGIPIELDLRPYAKAAARVLTVDVGSVSDATLTKRAASAATRARAGTPLDNLLPEVFALASEMAWRRVRMRPFDVQVMAAVALHRGRLAELATGEGKTLVAALAAVLDALEGRGLHIFTANDYLAHRDAEWMRPVYEGFGLRVASITQRSSRDERRAAYAADVTYVTAKEAGFDFLRDHTARDRDEVVQRPPRFVIVDEADFILIDEARVPLVIAGHAPAPGLDHRAMAAVAAWLRAGVDYRADEHARNVVVTDEGFQRAGAMLGRPLHEPAQHLLLSALHVALHARALLSRDRDYIVRDGRVELVDEFTGRVADNRRWPHGIQPAIEAKEGLEVRDEGRVLGSIPIQHFVGRYPAIAGMTATAAPAAEEFHAFYGLRTVVFPPNRPCVRADEPDVVFSHRGAKAEALVREMATVHATGRPILVGTASVAESESLAALLRERHVPCTVLNARHDAAEAAIVAGAGRLGAVTISTNMAGRGTDIVLGGGDPAERERVVLLGGLYVIGANRHESRRIDDQLRGRAGRQGDPGASRFFVSLEDDLIQRYGVVDLIPRGHRPARQDGPVSDPIVAREIARAQRIIEGQNFEIRKTLWRYSAIVDEQRQAVVDWRDGLLRDEVEQQALAAVAPDHFEALERAAGAGAVRAAENRLALDFLDRRWSDHLALIEDIREGIHLQRYGGKEPLDEFNRQVVSAFAEMMDGVRDDTVEALQRVSPDNAAQTLARTGIRGPASTWTYLVNDNPFSSFGISLIASRNIGAAAAVGFVAVLYWPVSMAMAASLFLRRWLARRRRSV